MFWKMKKKFFNLKISKNLKDRQNLISGIFPNRNFSIFMQDFWFFRFYPCFIIIFESIPTRSELFRWICWFVSKSYQLHTGHESGVTVHQIFRRFRVQIDDFDGERKETTVRKTDCVGRKRRGWRWGGG